MAGSRRRLARAAAAGFSLFEVLAAVAILGMLYTALARAAIGGLQTEGASERRLRASLLADEVLGELEQPFYLGEGPPVGSEEREVEDFLVEIDVQPLDLAPLVASLAGEDSARDEAPALLSVAAGGAPPLLQVAVRVSWVEGAREASVLRSTFGFDATAAAPALESIDSGEEGEPE